MSSRPALVVLLFLILSFNAFGEQEVVFTRPGSSVDGRPDYPRQLLDLAFKSLDKKYKLLKHPSPMQQGRAFIFLGQKKGVDIVWSMTSKLREERYLPVRIPIYKGLIGLRIPLILDGTQDKFGKGITKNAFLSLVAGQGHDWPDTKILRGANITVLGPSTYDGLFGMLAKQRIDYFPRSIVEIFGEAKANEARGLVVEPGIALYYPTALYFFVHKENLELHYDITTALEHIIASGEFDKLFYDMHQEQIDNAKLSSRKIYHLENPILPAETPLKRKELWFKLPD